MNAGYNLLTSQRLQLGGLKSPNYILLKPLI